MSFSARTMLRFRSRTSAMWIANPSCEMPNSLLRRKYDATFALWMMFLLGKHAMFGQEPPIYLRSTTATLLPSPAKVQAAMVEPVPPPRITRSNSSGCVFVLFMRIFLSERQVHSRLSLISPGQPLTLPRAKVHSRLLGQYALSTVECNVRAYCGGSLRGAASTTWLILVLAAAPYRSAQPLQSLPIGARSAP